jgi:biotin carboxyl carrier protein
VVTSDWVAAPLAAGRVLVTRGDERLIAHAVTANGTTWVWINGALFEFGRPRSGRRASGADNADALSPQMSAKVIRVSAAVGQTVAAGDVLVVLEAMKMEMPLRAPKDGVVKAINCAVGDLVQPGTVLVDL